MTLARRHEITRIEAFSDAVFAFALTLLVVSLDVPKSYHELMVLVRGFLPFGCCFALLIWIWYEHSAFFTRYALQDRLTVVLNAALLFVVLYYVYPLKYLFTLTFAILIPELRHEGGPQTLEQVVNLFVVYGLGFMAVFGVFALLYHHAWRNRQELGLSELDARDTRSEIGTQLVSVSIGLLSVLWALFAPRQLPTFAGFIYCLMGPAHWAYGEFNGRRRRAFLAQAHTPDVVRR
jgi:Endosomal/lysosomal potassium channel TMEM175